MGSTVWRGASAGSDFRERRHAAPLRRGCRAHYALFETGGDDLPFSSMTSKHQYPPSRPRGNGFGRIELAGGIEFLQIAGARLASRFGGSWQDAGGRGRFAGRGMRLRRPVRAGSAGGSGATVATEGRGRSSAWMAVARRGRWLLAATDRARQPAGGAGLIAPAPQQPVIGSGQREMGAGLWQWKCNETDCKRLVAMIIGMGELAGGGFPGIFPAVGPPDPVTFTNSMELGDVRQAEQWLDAGLPPDYPGNRIGSGLMIGAWEGKLELMRLFISRGADIDQLNANGESALALAAWRGQLAAVKWLLERGARINAPDRKWSALHYAVFSGMARWPIT